MLLNEQDNNIDIGKINNKEIKVVSDKDNFDSQTCDDKEEIKRQDDNYIFDENYMIHK